jgi:hypothetical protein
MPHQDQAGEHRYREGELRFEPPDVERGDQRADDGAERRVAAEQHSQQPGAGHQAGQIPADRRDGAKRRRHAFTAAEVEEHRIDVPQAGGDRRQAEVQRWYIEFVGQPDRQHPFQNIEHQHRRRRQPAADAQDVGRPGF